MKILKTLLITWAFTTQAGLPPTTLSGDQQATKPTTFTTTVPNSQATQVAGVKSRIETGNTNLLVNPSFEHSTVTTGWTVTNATASANLTDMVEGKKDLSLALTAALTVTQDSTVNAANLVGLQGVASIKIRTSDVTGLKVCARNAGVTSTTLCVNVVADGTWKHVVIPFIMTATSNGIAITSTGITGTVKIDDAFVGTSDPFQNVANDNTYQGSISSTGVLSGTDRTFFSSCSLSVGVATCTVSSSLGLTQPPSCVITVAAPPILWVITSSSSTTVVFSAVSGTTNQPINYACKKTGSDYSQSSKIYSQASQDYDWVAYTPTFGAGFGTVSAPNCFQQRRGHNLEVKCFPTSGTTAAAIGSITLPTGLAIDSGIIKATNTTAAAGQHIGEYQSASGAGNNSWIVTALGTSTSSVYVAGTFAGSSSLIPSANIGGILGNSTLFSVKFIVPISGWSDYGTIVGSFAGIEKCANDYECTDTFSAQVSAAGVVSNENLDFISGNCTVSGTSLFDCPLLATLKDGVSAITSKLNCAASVDNNGFAANFLVNYDTSVSSVSNLRLYTQNSNTGAAQVKGFTLKCQKGSQDYKPKTAKVASSIGVPTVPGLAGTTTAVDTFSVSYGATATTACTAASTACAYLDQIGTAVTNITRGASAGLYTINLGRTYTKFKCSINSGDGLTTPRASSVTACASCSSANFYTLNSAFAAADTLGTLICQGTY